MLRSEAGWEKNGFVFVITVRPVPRETNGINTV